MLIVLPIPQKFIEWLWLGIGITFGRAFGKKFDHDIQQSAWFKKQSGITQWVLKRLLDFTHHWWIGALLMTYAYSHVETYWFGYGLFLDDLPDIPARLVDMLSYLFKK